MTICRNRELNVCTSTCIVIVCITSFFAKSKQAAKERGKGNSLNPNYRMKYFINFTVHSWMVQRLKFTIKVNSAVGHYANFFYLVLVTQHLLTKQWTFSSMSRLSEFFIQTKRNRTARFIVPTLVSV